MVKGKRGDFKKRTLKAARKLGLDPIKDFEEPVKRPWQARLPGTEDNKILDIEESAIEHSEILSDIAAKKVDLKSAKDKIASLMKRENRTEYRCGSIHIRLRKGHDSISVQVKRHDLEAEKE